MLEGLHRVLVISGDKDYPARPGDFFGDLDPGKAGHPDIEEGDLRPVLLYQLQGLLAVSGLAAYGEIGPDLSKL
jgi:hypothetical protein